MAFNKKKSPVEVAVVWAMVFMAEEQFGKLLSTVNSSEVVPVQECALSWKKKQSTSKSFSS